MLLFALWVMRRGTEITPGVIFITATIGLLDIEATVWYMAAFGAGIGLPIRS